MPQSSTSPWLGSSNESEDWATLLQVSSADTSVFSVAMRTNFPSDANTA
jgi:hypothetical protein